MEEKGLIYDVKLSSVGPGNVTGPDSIFEPGSMGLAMKLHYLRGVYYLERPAFEGLSTLEIKEPMFTWLNQYPPTCGRFRRAESGRPYVKCNDCGLTKFKCGAAAVGLSWAHVLGDAFSAAEYMNSLGRVATGCGPYRPINLSHTTPKPVNSNGRPKVVAEPLSIKRVDPVGDNWTHSSSIKMETFSFNLTHMQLSQIQTKLGGEFSSFEAISAIMWKCIAKTRVEDSEPKIVTICKREENNKMSHLRNGQVVSVVSVDSSTALADPSKLASLVKNEAFDETYMIEEAMEREEGLADFIVYGANLTFVNLEEAGFYDFEYRGEKAVRVSYKMDGVGDKGLVMVLPGPKGEGRSIVVVVPENEINGLKLELEKEGFGA
ncbi:HXXXD-type acyl-transferase family protein [Striga asiatica]|uniref:HXXXD-type acyl-transferase family protein n=1 Tax=Striga asiatica TaxID=4170 RepID=A0A5A7Q8S8_STRAF|nr:HXXXD-type acyl-transferase family protein [Striga asiatica]